MSAPRLFVSYSHDSENHKRWVFDLAWRLRSEFGIDVILDVWDVTLGGDLPRFMEGIAVSDRVLMICTSNYVTKCQEAPGGGVAYEHMLVKPKVVANTYGNTIIPLLRDNDAAVMPVFIAGKRFIDFRDDAKFESLIRELAAAVHGVESSKPPIGLNPFRQGLDIGFGVNGRRVLEPNRLLPLRLSCSEKGTVAVGLQDDDVVISRLHPNGDPTNTVVGAGVLRVGGAEFGTTVADATITAGGIIITPRQDVPGAPYPAKRILLDGTVEEFMTGASVHAVLGSSPSGVFTCKDAIRLAVLESDGLPNPKFGHHGLLTISLPEAFPLQWMRAKAFDDGVYVFGMSRSKGNQNALLYKFLPNGDIDPSFGLEGCVTLSQSAWFLNVNDIERMSDGRLVIGGYGNEANVLRLYEDGSPDMSFGNNGFIEFRASGRSTCKKVALIDDSILIAGDASDGNSRNDIYVAKLMPDGRPDLDFHGDGYLSLTIKYRDNLVDFAVCGSSITLLCQSDCDAPRHFRSGLARVHL